MDYVHYYKSPLGGITLASDGTALTGLWFDGQKYFGYTLSKDHEQNSGHIFERNALSKSRVGNSAGDTLWTNDDLRRDCEKDRKTKRTFQNVGPGSGRCSGA